MNLYEISARYQQLYDQDELSLEDCAELESLHGSIEDECISMASYIRNKQAELAAVEQARQEMIAREKSLEDKIEKHMKWLATRMSENHITRISKHPAFPIAVKHNPVSVEITGVVAEEFIKTQVKTTEVKSIDKVAIKKALQEGKKVENCALISKLRIEFK